jgi:alpha-D-xyloside xylohydrolase
MIWGRAGWTGSQRYPIQWGGEPQSDWEGLAASIRGGLSWGMSGAPYHSSDVGGFYGSAQPTAELFVRWLQMAVFGSHLRMHGIGEREPWAFGEEAEAVARKWLAFRYRLIPYLEHTLRTATRTGLPVMRAMPLAYPANTLTRRYDTQFLCGDALLVAPVIQEGGEVEIALPPGGWFDLNSRTRYAGRQVLRYKASLEQFPVFGREGYALPLGRAVQQTGEIDEAAPVEQLWVFGKPAAASQTRQFAIEIAEGREPSVRVADGVQVQFFGDALPVGKL